MITCTAVESLDDNYIWMLDDGHDAVAVDPGEAAPVQGFLARRQLRLAAILLTHHHADHVGGVAELQHRRAGAIEPVAVYGPAGSKIPGVNRPVVDGARIELRRPALRLRVLATPGHTLDHLVYVLEPQSRETALRMFCGDTLFSCGCGRVFEGTPHQMVEALDRLGRLPESTLVHCAHEYTLRNIAFALSVDPDNPRLADWRQNATQLRREGVPTVPTTLRLEREVNPFLRIDNLDFANRVRRQFELPVCDRVGVFSALRAARNTFRTPEEAAHDRI